MQEEIIPKISVSPEDLESAGKILALAHPDTQQDMVAKSRRVGEVLPRDLEEVAGLIEQDPYFGFVQGKNSVYLSDRAAGEETREKIQRRRLVLEGDFGTWANREAPRVAKPFGGFTFGNRPAAQVDAPPGAPEQPIAPAVPAASSGAAEEKSAEEAPSVAQEAGEGGGGEEGRGIPLLPFLG